MEIRLKARGTTAQCESYVGTRGQIILDTGLWCIRSMDGVTPGGHIIPTSAMVNQLIQQYFDDSEVGIDDITGLTAALLAITNRLDVIETNGWVTTARIAAKAVTEPKLGDAAVINRVLAADSVNEGNINGAQIGSSRIKPLNIGGSHIANGSIGPEKLYGVGGSPVTGYAGVGSTTVASSWSYPGAGGNTSGSNLIPGLSGTWQQVGPTFYWGGDGFPYCAWQRVG